MKNSLALVLFLLLFCACSKNVTNNTTPTLKEIDAFYGDVTDQEKVLSDEYGIKFNEQFDSGKATAGFSVDAIVSLSKIEEAQEDLNKFHELQIKYNERHGPHDLIKNRYRIRHQVIATSKLLEQIPARIKLAEERAGRGDFREITEDLEAVESIEDELKSLGVSIVTANEFPEDAIDLTNTSESIKEYSATFNSRESQLRAVSVKTELKKIIDTLTIYNNNISSILEKFKKQDKGNVFRMSVLNSRYSFSKKQLTTYKKSYKGKWSKTYPITGFKNSCGYKKDEFSKVASSVEVFLRKGQSKSNQLNEQLNLMRLYLNCDDSQKMDISEAGLLGRFKELTKMSDYPSGLGNDIFLSFIGEHSNEFIFNVYNSSGELINKLFYNLDSDKVVAQKD
jgi:hypothetical protein